MSKEQYPYAVAAGVAVALAAGLALYSYMGSKEGGKPEEEKVEEKPQNA